MPYAPRGYNFTVVRGWTFDRPVKFPADANVGGEGWTADPEVVEVGAVTVTRRVEPGETPRLVALRRWSRESRHPPGQRCLRNKRPMRPKPRRPWSG
jgi:hypothetical protein